MHNKVNLLAFYDDSVWMRNFCKTLKCVNGERFETKTPVSNVRLMFVA